MWNNPNKVNMIKRQYPKGTRIRLIDMNDNHAVPSGTEGTVNFVDDAGQIHMNWDNGRTLALIPNEDSFTKISQAMQTFKLYMPLTVNEYTQYENGDWDDYPLELNDCTKFDYKDKILKVILDEREQEEGERGLMAYYDEDDGLSQKVHSFFFTVEQVGDKLMGVAECKIKSELNDDEIKLLKNWAIGQAADGAGESFEQHPIKVDNGELFVSLWNSNDDWNILTKDELDSQNNQQLKQTNGMQM